ncbi:MAG: hypothetical protein ACLTEH_00475, partial [Clostridia bacterium]
MKIKQRGITLIALVITIIILIILAGVSINMVIGDNGLIPKATQAKENMQIASNEEEEQLAKLTNELYNPEQIEIRKNMPNSPKLAEGMHAIKFTNPTEIDKGRVEDTNSNDSDWYNYDEKRWANSQTEDGSMWVWIPRYAYRVNKDNQTFDIVFLIGTTDNYYDENGNIQTAKRCNSVDENVDTSTGYT